MLHTASAKALGLALLGAVAFSYPVVVESRASLAACEGQDLSGSWRTVDAPKSGEVVSATIKVACESLTPNRPDIALDFTYRCLRDECRMGGSKGSWARPRDPKSSAAVLAYYTEERAEREVLIERMNRNRIQVTVTTRFLNVPVDPLVVSSTLERTAN